MVLVLVSDKFCAWECVDMKARLRTRAEVVSAVERTAGVLLHIAEVSLVYYLIMLLSAPQAVILRLSALSFPDTIFATLHSKSQRF